ncbi:hypothetical protein AJ85_20205 [Alkalihalobacillus alcalophilus ATCC 27647 = CGMCC 1.3604]|uniref:Uncharacterized protein n=1 Tax=Alkalihalobacillus alcalophilus ATCC 27647 = CGMCC 1.3604 TaxID=1218173 RepID=A0A094WH34_ALKAL|nr:hypothetical protein BALCAV_0212250 [Alkalihalobacillus alcalophilus ATCC 27647 = CGMCC 1.3604]THG88999.1 hypothetical protein AJ85_20205 [Alkalihalobacillus alcalophilus ATCC 27647 = CGMCC 1.3604]
MLAAQGQVQSFQGSRIFQPMNPFLFRHEINLLIPLNAYVYKNITLLCKLILSQMIFFSI